jgi:hypothetical protein
MSRLVSGTVTLLALGTVVVNSSGCSVMMAARAPERVDMNVLNLGEPRGRVVSELGVPVQSRDGDSSGSDVFAFKQGYSLPQRTGRVALHGLADVATIGLWELVGTPMETSLQGEDVRVQVDYDASNRVRRIEYFEGAHLAGNRMALARWMRRRSTRQTAVIEEFSNSAPFQTGGVSHVGHQQPTAAGSQFQSTEGRVKF